MCAKWTPAHPSAWLEQASAELSSAEDLHLRQTEAEVELQSAELESTSLRAWIYHLNWGDPQMAALHIHQENCSALTRLKPETVQSQAWQNRSLNFIRPDFSTLSPIKHVWLWLSDSFGQNRIERYVFPLPCVILYFNLPLQSSGSISLLNPRWSGCCIPPYRKVKHT